MLLISVLGWLHLFPGVSKGFDNIQPYRIVWNAPTIDSCTRFGVNVDPQPYGILENKRSGLVGSEITLFYSPGLFPYFDSDGRAVNGGLPQVTTSTSFPHTRDQLASLFSHFESSISGSHLGVKRES